MNALILILFCVNISLDGTVCCLYYYVACIKIYSVFIKMTMVNYRIVAENIINQTNTSFFFLRDSTQSKEEALSVLRSSGEFVRYAVCVAVQKIQQLEETGHTDGPDGQNPDRTFRFLCDMTKLASLHLNSI